MSVNARTADKWSDNKKKREEIAWDFAQFIYDVYKSEQLGGKSKKGQNNAQQKQNK